MRARIKKVEEMPGLCCSGAVKFAKEFEGLIIEIVGTPVKRFFTCQCCGRGFDESSYRVINQKFNSVIVNDIDIEEGS